MRSRCTGLAWVMLSPYYIYVRVSEVEDGRLTPADLAARYAPELREQVEADGLPFDAGEVWIELADEVPGDRWLRVYWQGPGLWCVPCY